MPQKYEVVKDLEVTDENHPLFGTHAPGTVLEVIASDIASVVSYVEEGFLKLIEPAAPAEEKVTPPSAETETPPAPAEVVPPPAPKEEVSVSTAAAEQTAALKAKFSTPPAPFENVPPMLYAFCKAIEDHEVCVGPGVDARFPQGTRAFFDKNPGNLRYRAQPNTVAEDKDGFAVFDTVEHGFMALVNQVELAISGRSTSYKNPLWDPVLKAWRHMNFYDFFKIYDSSFGDNPHAYAVDVAKQMDIPPETVINQLIA